MVTKLERFVAPILLDAAKHPAWTPLHLAHRAEQRNGPKFSGRQALAAVAAFMRVADETPALAKLSYRHQHTAATRTLWALRLLADAKAVQRRPARRGLLSAS